MSESFEDVREAYFPIGKVKSAIFTNVQMAIVSEHFSRS